MDAILAFLRSLWPWGRGRPAPMVEASPSEPTPIQVEPEPEPEPEADVEVVQPAPPADPLLALVEEGDEEAEADEEVEDDFDDPSAPDPFISDEAPLLETEATDDLEQRREAARAQALEGEHRIFLTDKAGPGSLAEALNQLLKERRVTAEFQEGEEGGGFILYRPEML